MPINVPSPTPTSPDALDRDNLYMRLNKLTTGLPSAERRVAQNLIRLRQTGLRSSLQREKTRIPGQGGGSPACQH